MHHFTPVERAGEPGGDLRRHSQTEMGHCHPNLGILWLIQSHCSQQQLLEEPASPGMDALGCRGNLSRSAGGDIPPGYPKLTKNALIYTASPSKGHSWKENPFSQCTSGDQGRQAKGCPSQMPFLHPALLFFHGGENPNPPHPCQLQQGSAELTSRSRESSKHYHTSTEHRLFHCSPPPNQQQRHHPIQKYRWLLPPDKPQMWGFLISTSTLPQRGP